MNPSDGGEHGRLLNVSRVKRVLADAGADVLIGTTPGNVTYCSGFYSSVQWRRPSVQCFTVIDGENPESVHTIIPHGELDRLLQQGLSRDGVITYGNMPYDVSADAVEDLGKGAFSALLHSRGDCADPLECLTTLICSRGWQKAVIAVDEHGTSFQTFKHLRTTFPKMTIIPGYELLLRIRSIKTDEEVRRIRRATWVAEGAVVSAIDELKCGSTEMRIADHIHSFILSHGGFPSFTQVGTGKRSALANAEPSRAVIEYGDVVRFDVGCRLDYYCSDIAATAVIGKASSGTREQYNALQAGFSRILELVRAGVSASFLFEEGMDTVHRHGIEQYERLHLGHGLGIEGYEPPMLSPDCDVVLEAGMVLCVETPYYVLGRHGLQIEETILVTEDGCERLALLGRPLFEVEDA